MKKQYAWILGGSSIALLAAGGVMMNGCSNNPGTGDAGGKDAMTNDVMMQQDTGGEAGYPTDCKKDPSIHPQDAGVIYCTFNAVIPDGGVGDAAYVTDAGDLYCTQGDQCCLGGSLGGGQYAPEMCAPWGTQCNNPPPPTDGGKGGGFQIECNQTADCTANGATGTVCCLHGASAPAVITDDAGLLCDPTNLKSAGGSGATCDVPGDAGVLANTCTQSGDLQLCQTSAECPTGKTCQAFRWKIYEIGACM